MPPLQWTSAQLTKQAADKSVSLGSLLRGRVPFFELSLPALT